MYIVHFYMLLLYTPDEKTEGQKLCKLLNAIQLISGKARILNPIGIIFSPIS